MTHRIICTLDDGTIFYRTIRSAWMHSSRYPEAVLLIDDQSTAEQCIANILFDLSKGDAGSNQPPYWTADRVKVEEVADTGLHGDTVANEPSIVEGGYQGERFPE